MTGRETDATPAPFTMLGGQGVVCEGDACLLPGDPGGPDPAS